MARTPKKLPVAESEGRRLFAEFVAGANHSELARAIGTSREMIRRLAEGLNGPGIEIALRIERVSYGKVPIVAWVTPARVETAA